MDANLDKEISDLIETARTLEYEGETGWLSCPEWAAYLIGLGAMLGAYSPSGNPIFTIISVPERSFASAFLGMGIVLARALFPNHEEENKKRVEQLMEIGKGATVILRNEDRKLDGHFMRIDQTGLGEYIFLKVDERTLGIPVSDAYRIEISDKPKTNLPKKQTGKLYKEISGLVERLISRRSLNDFQIRTSEEVVFVGPKKRLLFEMESTKFSIRSISNRTNRQTGFLVDLLRPKTLMSRGSAYRARVLPSGNAGIGVVIENMKPFTFVFDGALALVKWGVFGRHSNQIAILDRTEVQYEASIEAVNDLYIDKRTQDQVDFELPEPPVGITVSAFPVMGEGS